MTPRMKLSARAQALALLLLAAVLGAALGIMGDRLVAQQRSDDLIAVGPFAGEPPADVTEPVQTEPAAPQQQAPQQQTPQQQTPQQQTPQQQQPQQQQQAPAQQQQAPAPGDVAPPLSLPLRQPPVPYADRMFALLELTPEQRAAVDSLMVVQQARVRLLTEQVEPRFQNIMRQTQQEIQALLTPEQRQQLRRLQQERSRLLQDPRLRPPPQQRVDQLREDIMRQLREENAQRARDMRARQNDRMRGGLPPVRPDTLDRRLPR